MPPGRRAGFENNLIELRSLLDGRKGLDERKEHAEAFIRARLEHEDMAKIVVLSEPQIEFLAEALVNMDVKNALPTTHNNDRAAFMEALFKVIGRERISEDFLNRIFKGPES